MARPEVMGCRERGWLIPVPLSHVWMPRAWEEKKRPRAAFVTTGARWPLQGDGLVLKHPKTPAKCALDQRDPGKDPFRGCTEHSFGPKLRGVMWGLSIPVQLPPCLFQLQHPSLFQHPHPAVTGLQGCTSTPAASHCSRVLSPCPAAGQWQRDLGTPQHPLSPQTTASPATPQVLKSHLTLLKNTGYFSNCSHPYIRRVGQGWGEG